MSDEGDFCHFCSPISAISGVVRKGCPEFIGRKKTLWFDLFFYGDLGSPSNIHICFIEGLECSKGVGCIKKVQRVAILFIA